MDDLRTIMMPDTDDCNPMEDGLCEVLMIASAICPRCSVSGKNETCARVFAANTCSGRVVMVAASSCDLLCYDVLCCVVRIVAVDKA